MTTINRQLVSSQKTVAGSTPEVFYTSPLNQSGTIITNFTAVNDTTSTISYTAYIVSSSGSPTVPVVPQRNITTNRTDVPAELAGQFIPAGGTLQMETSSAAPISFTVSGRELS